MKKRQWSIQRSMVEEATAQHRWDRAYQYLLQIDTAARFPTTQELRGQEKNDEYRGLVRVSTQRQAQAQTIEQQLDRLRTYHEAQEWPWQEENIFRDDGYSGAKLRRPGLDRLRE